MALQLFLLLAKLRRAVLQTGVLVEGEVGSDSCGFHVPDEPPAKIRVGELRLQPVVLRGFRWLPEIVNDHRVDGLESGAEPVLLHKPIAVVAVLREDLDRLSFVLAEGDQFGALHSDLPVF